MTGRVTRRAVMAAGAAAPFCALEAASPTLIVTPPLTATPHDPGPGGWDRPERLATVVASLARPGFRAATRAPAPIVSREALLRVHEASYIQRIAAARPINGFARLAPDAVMSSGTHEASLRAAGGAVLAVEAVTRGVARNAFVASRPPGHHALSHLPMGFCFFNNAAIAARHALAVVGAQRVAIVDFDAHHGNGLQQIFWAEPRVLYCSTHQAPLYPGTGAASERGEFDNIVNAPLARGDGGRAFREAWTQRILPRVQAFSPDLIVVCAGFDGHLHDPLCGLRLLAEDFADITLRIIEVAARRCGGRIVSLLEGGYRPEDLSASVAAHVGALIEA